MARFQFSLEKVLRWRVVELTGEEAKLKALVQEQLHLQTLLAEVSAERSNLISSLGKHAGLAGRRPANPDRVRPAAAPERGKSGATAACNAGANSAKQRKKYSEAKRRVRLLEELKARRLQEWKYEEAALLEELASESFLANWNRERI